MKIYVQVGVIADQQGEWMPLRIYWEDGRVFEIEKVTEIWEAKRTAKGCPAKRFTCVIKGRPKYLYAEGSRWYVEGKQAPTPDTAPCTQTRPARPGNSARGRS